jgi:hypothetical protein
MHFFLLFGIYGAVTWGILTYVCIKGQAEGDDLTCMCVAAPLLFLTLFLLCRFVPTAQQDYPPAWYLWPSNIAATAGLIARFTARRLRRLKQNV